MLPFTTLLPILAGLVGAQAASKDQWRSRSIYQLLTDRFAPPSGIQECKDGTYCGGTWRTMMDKLDYIQGLGADAVWISPTGLGLEGFSKWGENYHGYWSTDPFEINSHFGTSDDLKALSAALHDRGMYLMVDIAVNHLASTDTDISSAALAKKADGKLLFQQESDFHPLCQIEWENRESELSCWLATDGVALMDLRVETPAVADVLKQKFAAYIKEYNIDGARLDAAKLMDKQFVHDLCVAGGVFCIGELLDGGALPAEYTQGQGIDSVFGFPMMYGAIDVFTKDSPMSALASKAKSAASDYADPTVIASVLDNHDTPRFGSLTSDKSKIYNAMALEFLFGGIPAMYYGLEQDISTGSEDPANRRPLWEFGDYATDGVSYQRIKRLNTIRRQLGELGGFHEVVGSQVGLSDEDIAFERNGALLVLTKRGAGQGGMWAIAKAGFPANAKVVDLLSCSEFIAGADGSLQVAFDDGLPLFFVTADIAGQLEVCGGSAPVSSAVSLPISTSGIPSSSTTAHAVTSQALNAPVLV